MQVIETWFYVTLIFIFTIAAYYQTLTSMKTYIDDNDPTSYVVIILPIFFIFLVFFYMKELESEKDPLKFLLAFIFIGSAITLYTQNSLNSSLSAYRLDLLSIPLFITGAVILFFGIESAKRLRFILLYLFLIWPFIFSPIYPLQNFVTDITADVAHQLIKVMGLPIQRIPRNVFSSGEREQIEIAKTCVALGAFIGLFVLLLPFINSLSGENKNKGKWIVSGIVLVWLLNLIRIMAIILLWFYSGLSDAMFVFHTFGGNFIFDVSLVISLLSLKFFKLKLKF